MLEIAREILKTKKVFALIGVTQDKTKYGYEVFHALNEFGYKVYPVNPKYGEVDGVKCYASLKELLEKPEVVIVALSPVNTEKIIEGMDVKDVKTIWMPPGCWSEEAVNKCESKGMDLVYDVCPVGVLLSMKRES